MGNVQVSKLLSSLSCVYLFLASFDDLLLWKGLMRAEYLRDTSSLEFMGKGEH